MDVTGGCLCGAVRYTGTRADRPMFRCHCRDCQRLTGTGHADMVPLTRSDFTVSEALVVHEMTGGSGQPTWSGFCRTCGSQIMRRSARISDCVYVHASSLDDPELYRPERVIHADAAPSWDAPG